MACRYWTKRINTRNHKKGMKKGLLFLLAILMSGGVLLGMGTGRWPLTWLTQAKQAQAPVTAFVDYIPRAPTKPASGLCWARSEVLTLANAWRCGTDTGTIYDPCFSIAAHDDTQVVCGADPATGATGIWLTLRESLALPPIEQQTPQFWRLALVDQTTCTILAGATLTFANQPLRYQCDDGHFILGDLQPGPTWLARKVAIAPTASGYQLTAQTEVAVRTVWRAALPPALLTLTEAALQNAVYQIDGQQVKLSDGRFDDTADAVGFSRPIYRLTDWRASANLNGDASEDQVLVLTKQEGGSGTLLYLAVVLNYAGQPFYSAVQLLGDRVTVEALEIVHGQIVVTLLTQGPADAMCCPSQRERHTYALQQNALQAVATEVLTPAYFTRVANATYTLTETQKTGAPKTVKLVNGRFAETGLQVELLENDDGLPLWTIGQLTGGSAQPEAVTVLKITQGNNTQRELVVLSLDQTSEARPLAQLRLDERIQFDSLSIDEEKQQIVLNQMNSPITDATRTDSVNNATIWRFAVVDRTLVLQSAKTE